MKEIELLKIKNKVDKNEVNINSVAKALHQTNQQLDRTIQTMAGVLNIVREMDGFDKAMEKAKAIQDAKNKKAKEDVKDMEVVEEEEVKSFEIAED